MDIDDAARFRRQAEVCREESSKSRELVDAQSGCALPTISRSWLRKERAAVGDRRRSPCERPDRKLHQSYGSRAQLQSVLFRKEWPNSSPGGLLVRQ